VVKARPAKRSKPTRKTRTKKPRSSGPVRGKEVTVVGSYTQNSRTVGRKPRKTLSAAWKLLDANKSSMVQTFNRYNQFGGSVGLQKLVNCSAAGATFTPPCHIYDLTSTTNVRGETIIFANPYFHPDFTQVGNTGVMSWNENVGFNGKTWEVTETGGGSLNNWDTYPAAECTLDWVSVKLLMYCPSGQVSKTSIDVCQFTDDRVVPGAVNPYATAFWQAATKSYSFSPLESGGLQYSKHIKRLHSQSFIMEPKESIETGEGNHYRMVNVFLRLNRAMRYDWANDAPMSFQDLDPAKNASADIQVTPLPKKRVFLMIRSQCGYNPTYGHDPIKHGSYDIVIRKKQTQMTS